MATKANPKTAKKTKKTRARAIRKPDDGLGVAQLIGETLGRHDEGIRQLAEVVVNLHANIRALRDVVEALAAGASDRRALAAVLRLRRVKLDD